MSRSVVHPGRQVVACLGDGAIGFCGMDVDTLVRHHLPVVMVATKDINDPNSVLRYEKTMSNVKEVKARSGIVIAVATEGDEEIKESVDHVLYVPHAPELLLPILEVVPLQLLAYHIAVLRGCDVDQPRNLAKSVTVE